MDKGTKGILLFILILVIGWFDLNVPLPSIEEFWLYAKSFGYVGGLMISMYLILGDNK